MAGAPAPARPRWRSVSRRSWARRSLLPDGSRCSSEVKKTEILMENFRRPVVRSRRTRRYEGEVTELRPRRRRARGIRGCPRRDRAEDRQGNQAAQALPHHLRRAERTRWPATSSARANPVMKRVGRHAYATDDLEAEERAASQGDVHKKKEIVDVTLHDLDSANAKPQAAGHHERLGAMMKSKRRRSPRSCAWRSTRW